MTESVEEKLLRLVRLLAKKTREGAISWATADPFGDEQEVYEYSTPSSTVSIGEQGPRNFLFFEVKNSAARVIGALRITENTSSQFDENLDSLFDAARRNVLKVDETLDALIRDVENR